MTAAFLRANVVETLPDRSLRVVTIEIAAHMVREVREGVVLVFGADPRSVYEVVMTDGTVYPVDAEGWFDIGTFARGIERVINDTAVFSSQRQHRLFGSRCVTCGRGGL